ncbi:flagellar hook-length control protein FliK [Massilia sp. TWR1-2-2]|uniref:flagellar hook-length control protein FliK n=1 Tax=Massilia sp. TWR1-2-2 TaxID=2804584 RepID=UPI003CF6FCC5
MIPAADIVNVAPVARITPVTAAEAVADARQQEFQRSLSGQVGKSMQAEVLSRLTDGSFLVRVAGTPARMMLPSNPQPGAEVPLTLVALTPRPTFKVTGSPQSAPIPAFVADSLAEPGAGAGSLASTAASPAAGPAAGSAAGSAAGAAAGAGAARAGAMQRAASLFSDAPAASLLSESDSSSTRSTLSDAARVITTVLGAAARAPNPQNTIVAPLPLLPAASADPVKLAAVLKDAIGASGLFYESHVAEWSAGKRALTELQREPQMQRAAARQEAGPAVQASASPASAAAAFAPGGAIPADPATAQFINLQLSSHEQGRVAWQGQLWPGQHMSWQISRDPPERSERQSPGGEAPEAPWRSALRLRFAALGEIGATVVLAGDQLHIQLQPGSDAIGNLLRARAGELQRALEASGNPPASLTVGAAREPGNV